MANSCIDCGIKTSGYGERCRSCAAIKLWASSEYRRTQAEAMEKARATVEYHNRLVEGSERRWANPKAHQEQSEIMKEVAADPKWRDNISKTTKAAWARGCYDDVFTEEWKVRNSMALKAAWARGDYGGEEYQCERSKSLVEAHGRGCYDDMFTEEARCKMSMARLAAHERGVYDGVCGNPSSLELGVAESLDTQRIKYTQQFRPEGMTKPFDFYFPDTNILLEIQGDYWHNLPGAWERDKVKAEEAIDLGYIVYEIWEHDLKELGILGALEHVLKEVNRQR